MNYDQATGRLTDENGLVGIGWAGQLAGKNNPAMQNVPKTGPLPVGNYVINDPINDPKLGPVAFPLTPDPANEMFGRAGFFIHGADIRIPSLSSEGCIVQQRTVREYIEQKIAGSPLDSPLRQLTVFNSNLSVS